MSGPADRRCASWVAAGIAAAFLTLPGYGQRAASAQAPDARQVAQISEWFSAWELVSVDVYGVETLRPVDFVFFDSTSVYTTSEITGAGGTRFEGPRLLNRHYLWRFAEHNGSIDLPDGSTVPSGLMSFAAPADRHAGRAFFVMPLPDFWEAADVKSDELGLENLLTGVFLHEFSHSQQMHNFGAQMSAFERRDRLDEPLTDDVVQETFERDERYESRFRDEVALFYDAAHSRSAGDRLALARQAMDRYRTRQQQYFVGDRALFRELDDFFLTMEGFGQFTMYAWLVHPEGGGLGKAVAEAGVRRGGKWWSQEEGLALFLLLQRFSAPRDWAGSMFGEDYGLVTDLIETELATD
jgi:hypothetical protein